MRSILYGSLFLATISSTPVAAETLSLETTPFRIQPSDKVFLLVGGSANIKKVDFSADWINLDAEFRFYAKRKDLEVFLLKEIRTILPIKLAGDWIRIDKIDALSIDPQPDGFHVTVDAVVGNNWKSAQNHMTAVLDSKTLAWATSQALIRIVTDSLHIQYLDLFKWPNPTSVVENILQKYLDGNIDKKHLRAYLPGQADLSGLSFAYDKYSARVAFQGHMQAKLDKSAFESQITGMLADLTGGLEESRSVGVSKKTAIYKVVGPN